MSSLWKKLGSAFVEMPENEESAEGGVSDADIDALLAASGVDELASASPAPVAAPAPAKTPLDWSLSEVFVAGGVRDGRNSAASVLTLLNGLAAIPEDQRLIALRAMDTADDGWDEETVLTDATKRLQVLGHYGQHIDRDEAARIAAVNDSASGEKAELSARVTELEQQIATLTGQKDAAVSAIASATAHAEDGVKAVRLKADGVRGTVKTEAAKYKGLLAFFGKVAG